MAQTKWLRLHPDLGERFDPAVFAAFFATEKILQTGLAAAVIQVSELSHGEVLTSLAAALNAAPAPHWAFLDQGFYPEETLTALRAFDVLCAHPKAQLEFEGGHILSGSGALKQGFIERVFGNESAFRKEMERLGALSFEAMASAKTSVRRKKFGTERRLFALGFTHGDVREGLAAFLEKRNPEFGAEDK